MRMLSGVLRDESRYPEAEKLALDHLAVADRVLGPGHPNTIQGAEILGSTLTLEGRYAEAEKLYREEFGVVRRAFGQGNAITWEIADCLAQDLAYEGRHAEAEKLLRETLEDEQRVVGPEAPETLSTLMLEAVNVSYQGHYDDAETEFRKVIQMAGKKGQPPFMLGGAWEAFACGAAAAGHRDAAFEYLGQAIDHGYSNPVSIRDDPDLKSLHGDPRFDALLAKATQIAAAKSK
jgi:tetratricopeptide (TPR) repeat protein